MNDEGRLTAEDLADLRLAWCSGSGTVIATVERILAARASDGLAEEVRALADELRGLRFRIETACDGYAALTDDDIPGDVFMEDDYIAGASDAAYGIRSALLPADTQDTDQ